MRPALLLVPILSAQLSGQARADLFAVDLAAVGDLDGDGVSELAVVDPFWPAPGGVVWILSGADLSVQRRIALTATAWSVRPLVADGEVRLLTPGEWGSGVSIEYDLQGSFRRHVGVDPPSSPPVAVAADRNADGWDELLQVQSMTAPTQRRHVALHHGGSFAPAWVLDDSGEERRLAMLSGRDLAPIWVQEVAPAGVACGVLTDPGLDLDGDGVDEVVVSFADVGRAGRQPRVVTRVLSGISGDLLAGGEVCVTDASAHRPPRIFALGDVDGDGGPDLLLSASVAGGHEEDFVALGLLDGLERYRFTVAGLRAAASTPDLSGDGVPDLALGLLAFPDDRVEVRSGADGGLLYRAEPVDFPFGTALAVLGDVDGDSVPDLAVAAKLASQPDRPGSFTILSGATGQLLSRRSRADYAAPDSSGR